MEEIHGMGRVAWQATSIVLIYIAHMHRFVGEIISVNMLGRQMIILNSLEDAKELLQKRGYNYSDRPRFTLLEL